MARLVVDKLDGDPALVAHERRLHGALCQASLEWERILARPWSEIRAVLLDESDEGQRVRSSQPFAGLVSDAERLAIMRAHPAPAPAVAYDPSLVPDDVMERVLNDRP